MSLDVYLTLPGKRPDYPNILVGEDGRDLTWEEWDKAFPDLKIYVEPEYVYHRNITHNLGKMASAAGIYEALWRPEEIGITHARQLIDPLKEGLDKLERSPTYFEQFNSDNGWGLYGHLVPFVREYLAACIESPDALVRTSR